MPLKPALLTIFGTTGDLARKKLYPALFALHQSGHLDPRSAIVGIGRRPWDDAHFKEIIASSVESFRPASGEVIKAFLDRFVYHRMDMTDDKAYASLWDRIHSIEETQGTGGNRLYFLATAPDLFPKVSHQIGTCISKNSAAFRRLMIEKPFGQDLPSARSFNQKLRNVFDENEIFRIDHYLGKEMLQNILVVRFSNRLFEPAWNQQHIDHIQVSVLESDGVDQRSGYYDQSGALRDMIQSHLLQLVALLSMNQPENLDPDHVRDEKVRVLRSIRPFSLAQAKKDVVLAQYTDNDTIRGYRGEAGIPKNSQTETYAAMRLWIDNERWRNVPFYLRTGKQLNKRVAKITVVFRQNDLGSMQSGHANRLIIRIQPEEGIDLQFNIKRPGMTSEITEAHMNACQNCKNEPASPQAYEKLFYDAWSGDLSLFTRWDEIEATWSLVDSIQKWKTTLPLYFYPAKSTGPVAADQLIKRDGRTWLDL